jgi:hypothetical protein
MSAEIRRLLDDLEYAANLIEGRIDREGSVFQPLLRERVARLRAHREQLLVEDDASREAAKRMSVRGPSSFPPLGTPKKPHRFPFGMNTDDHAPDCDIRTSRDGWDANCTCGTWERRNASPPSSRSLPERRRKHEGRPPTAD